MLTQETPTATPIVLGPITTDRADSSRHNRVGIGRRPTDSDAVPRQLAPLVWAGDALQYVVAIVLVGAAITVLGRALYEAVAGHQRFSDSLLTLIDSVLFVIIVLEIFSTVVDHFRSGGFHLRPFLVIGIVSAVRHILIVGAESSLGGSVSHFSHTMTELVINTGIALVLVVALVLVHRNLTPDENS